MSELPQYEGVQVLVLPTLARTPKLVPSPRPEIWELYVPKRELPADQSQEWLAGYVERHGLRVG
jgi:hypothetical protein